MLPGGVTVKQEYNAAGYLYQTIADGTVISEIKAMDDAGRVTQAAFVGGSKRKVAYMPERGFIKNIEVQDGLNNTLYTVDYGYSLRGDTKSRLSKYSNQSKDGHIWTLPCLSSKPSLPASICLLVFVLFAFKLFF